MDKIEVNMHLILKGKWYDAILHGDKKEEYRACSKGNIAKLKRFAENKDLPHYITFHRGYTKESFQIRCSAVAKRIMEKDCWEKIIFGNSSKIMVLWLKKEWGYSENCQIVYKLFGEPTQIFPEVK